MNQTTKLNTNWKNFLVKTLSSMIIMTLVFILISLYVPIKGVFLGEKSTLIEFLSYIELKKYSAVIIAVSIALNTKELRKEKVISPNGDNI